RPFDMSPGGRYLAAALLGDLRDRVCCLVGHGTTTPARRLRSCRMGALAPCATAIIRAFHGRKRAPAWLFTTSRPSRPRVAPRCSGTWPTHHRCLDYAAREAIRVLIAQEKPWMPAQASLPSLRQLGRQRRQDAAYSGAAGQRDAETIGDSVFTHWRASRS